MVEGYIKELVTYLKKNVRKGYTPESLKWSLTSQGYGRSEISRAIIIANEELANEAPKLEVKPEIRVQREPILQELYPQRETFKDRFGSFWGNIKELFTS